MAAIDLTTRMQEYAWYLPSMQRGSAERITKSEWTGLPNRLRPSDFNYLDPSNPFWSYGRALASAESFRGSEQNAFTTADQSTMRAGDSGGFQYGGSGGRIAKWKGFSEEQIVAAWKTSDFAEEVTDWCELHASVAMTLDLPPWALRSTNSDSPLHSCTFQTLLDLSVHENCGYLMRRRQTRGLRCKYLNVLQGDQPHEEAQWYEQARQYKFDGWSLAGGVGTDGGPYRVLRRLLILRDDGLLDPGLDWVHLLKQTQPCWAIMLTAMQRGIRASNNNNKFQITYDSSTPYQEAGVRERYAVGPLLNNDLSTWHFKYEQFPSDYEYAIEKVPIRLDIETCQGAPCAMCRTTGRHLAAPLESPIARTLTAQDVVTNKERFAIRRIGPVADELRINHNVYVVVEGLCRANEAVFGRKPTAPQVLLDAVGEVERLCNEQNWHGRLNAQREMLEKIVNL